MLFRNKVIIVFNLFLFLIVFAISKNLFLFANLKSKFNYCQKEKFELLSSSFSHYKFNKTIAFYKATFIKVEKVEDYVIYYYFSPLLEKQINCENKNFNLQIIINGNNMQICYPINYLSF